jgi:hypothetical protein
VADGVLCDVQQTFYGLCANAAVHEPAGLRGSRADPSLPEVLHNLMRFGATNSPELGGIVDVRISQYPEPAGESGESG